ncbi:gamma-glutamylcyclotransferase family protein [Roseomonas sp. BN140053]|uniref:gamma-glutamylcyclotransferase family protein n=1 Tax=Roseomonas sp. BN140053 TaxID=3391898 RepID=UPI0039EAF4F0
MTALLFLYGTLLDPAVLRRQSGDPRLIRSARPAVLPGHARVFFRGTPWPTLRPCPGGQVAGLVVRPTPSAMARLRTYEGRAYRLVPLRVLGRQGPLRVRGFAVPRRMATLRRWEAQ